MRMDRLKIAHRIFTGQGLLLFLLLLIGGGAFVGLTIIDSSFSDYRRIARNSNLIAAVDQNVSQTRIQMKDFLLSGDEVFVPRIQEATKEVDALLAEAEKALINPSRRAMLAELTATFATYKTTISDVVSLDAKIDKVSADILDKNAPMALGKLDQALRLADSDGDARTAMLIANTERDFLLVRFYMQRFENLRDEATQGALTKALADLERSTKALVDQSRGARRTLVGEIVQHLTDYREGATTKMNLLHETETIVQARLNPSGGKLSKLTQDIAESQTGQQNQIGPQVVATINTIEASAIGLSILSVLLGIGGSMIVARSITQPVNSLTATMGRLADGDLSVDVGFTDNRDEIGDMSRALEVFKTNGIERRRLEEEQAAAREARERRAQALETLMGRFDQDVQALVGELGSASTQMRASAQSMSALSEQTAQQSMSVASAAEQASANVQAVATATEELSSSLGEITRRVAESAQITRVAYDQANETNRTVNSLSEAAGRIGTVVQLIADIAGQTNLLALNATIEAARAGEAGKGFAVVASEVKSLATQTARATGDISEQVQQVQSATQQAVDAIRSITGTIARVNEIAAAIAAAVEEQGAATQEIARNVQQAAAGTQDVTSTIDSVRGAADETGQSAGEVLNAAVSLQSQSTRLTQVVGSFLTGVKAA